MAIGNELLQGIIAATIVAFIVILCCLFYWCKIRKQKVQRNVILEQVQIESQKDSADGRLQPKGIKQKEDKWYKQERKRKLHQIVNDHLQREGRALEAPQLRQFKELDLHNYTLKEAMEVFQLFLIVSLEDYYETDQELDRFINVITGRGKHSKDGIPVIKMNVTDFLVKNCYTHSWPNPGMVRIDLFSKIQGLGINSSQTNGQKSLRQIMSCNII